VLSAAAMPWPISRYREGSLPVGIARARPHACRCDRRGKRRGCLWR
jgi:hypothetical protein